MAGSGPVNAVAPRPARERHFARTLGRLLRRPALLPAPAPLLRLALGPMARELLLSSQRLIPRKLRETGFRWQDGELEGALRSSLEAPRSE